MLVASSTFRLLACSILVGVVLMSVPISAQDLTGSWHGELVLGRNERFTITMELRADAGRLTGTVRSTFPFQPEHYAVMAVEGERRGGRYHLRETGITEQSATGYRWVLQGGTLALDTNDVQWRLYGEWRPPGCEAGQLRLFRHKGEERPEPDVPTATMVLPERVEDRKVHWAGTVKVRADSVVLWLYDDLKYDGDTVSVFVNGHCVAHRIEVPHRRRPRALTVYLVPGTNHLVLHAENLGSEAPNTAGLAVRARGRRHRLVLRSTMKHSAGLVITSQQ